MLRNLPECFTRARLLYLLCKEGTCQHVNFAGFKIFQLSRHLLGFVSSKDSLESSTSSTCHCASGKRILFAMLSSTSSTRSQSSVFGTGLRAFVIGVFPARMSERCAFVRGTKDWRASSSTIATTVSCIQVYRMSVSQSCFVEHSESPSLHLRRRSRCPRSSKTRVETPTSRKSQAVCEGLELNAHF